MGCLSRADAEWIAEAIPELEALTGHPVRSAQRRPGEVSPWPEGAVSVVAPSTLNTINSAALGLTPNWATGHMAEAIGKRWPLVVMTCVNSTYATHPQFGRRIETLRAAGVRVLYGEGGFVPYEPGQGRPGEYPWHLALEAAAGHDDEPSEGLRNPAVNPEDQGRRARKTNSFPGRSGASRTSSIT